MKRIANFVLVVGALSAGFLLGQTTNNFDKWWTAENDALAAAPQNHKLPFENDEVRVLEVTVQPGSLAQSAGWLPTSENSFAALNLR